MKKNAIVRRAAWALAVATLTLAACEPKPSNPPKPTTTHIDSPVDVQPRPVDYRLLT